MDDTLKRRLTGTAVLLALAFLLVTLLPSPRLHRSEDKDLKVVTIDLRAPDHVAVTSVSSRADDDAAQSAAGSDRQPSEHQDAAEAVDDAPPEVVTGDADPAPEASLADAKAAPRAEPTPAPRPTPKPAPPPKPKPQPKPQPEPTPAPAAKPAPAPAVAPTAPAQATVHNGKWWVQVGSFSSIENARSVQERLRDLHQPTLLAPVETAKGTLYRVRGGPYASEAQARAAQSRIVDGGMAHAQLIHP